MIFDLTKKINPKILVLGPRDSGKTSLLSSMLEECIYEMSDTLLFSTDTQSDQKALSMLNDVRIGIQATLLRVCDKEGSFIPNFRFYNNITEYNLRLLSARPIGKLKMKFLDIPGAFLDGDYSQEYFSIELKDSDVVIVTIDTPFLMHSDLTLSKSLNQIDNISRILQYLSDTESKKEKEVIFVPVKCEKWVQSGETDKVIQRIKDQFTFIRNILPDNQISFSIIPAETIGGMVFDEFKGAYMLYDRETKKDTLCSKLNEQYVRFVNGTIHKLHENDILTENPRIGLNGEKYPLEWFRLSTKKKGYSPSNCYLIMVEILRFLLNRQNIIDKANKSIGRIPRIGRHETYLGTFNKELLSQILMSYPTEGIHKY